MTELEEIVHRKIAAGHEIMVLTCNGSNKNIRMTTTSRDRKVQLWSLDHNKQLSNIFSIKLLHTIPCTLHFQGINIIVFRMNDREV